MDTVVERLDSNKVKVAVTVPAQTVDELFKTAYQQTNKSKRIPGFRPGKAPRTVLDTTFGKEYFASMVTDTILNDICSVAVDEEDIIFLSEPEYEDTELAVEGEDFSFALSGEVKPLCTLSSYDPVDIELPPVEATDEEIDAQIDTLREYYVNYNDVDRAAQKGDTLFADLVCTLNGEDLSGISGEDRQCELGAGTMPEEFDAAFIGCKAGDEKEFDFSVADDPMQVVGEDEKVHVKATVKRVTEKCLPELTDEWVKETCKYESVEDFRTRISSSIVSQKADMLGRLKEEACGKALGARLEGEVSETFLADTKNELFRTFFYQLQSQNLSLEQYCINNQISPDQLQEDLGMQADDRAAENLALDALANHLGFKATSDEVRAEFANSGAENPSELLEEWRKNGRLAIIREGIQRSRASEWVKNTANVTIVDPAKKAAEDAEKPAAKKKATKKASAAKAEAETSGN